MTRVISRLRAFLLVVLLGLSVSACGYNQIPTLQENAKAKWADVQNDYQRRADLIPKSGRHGSGLCQAGKGCPDPGHRGARQGDANHMSRPDDLTDPGKLKAFQDAQAQLGGALGRLLAVSENYPDLKSNQNFLALQSQLEGTENRIAVARRDYIEAVGNIIPRLSPSLGFSGHRPCSACQADGGIRRQ